MAKPSTQSVLAFSLNMLPPSVNHYIEHPAKGVHLKSPAAKAWERDFMAMLPAHARGEFVTGDRFQITLVFTPGPGGRGDVDNYNKQVLDCCAKAGMLRNAKGKILSDAWFKRLVVDIRDSDEDRLHGPRTDVTIEAI